MATKRGPSPELISNPFIKKRNLEWSLEFSSSTPKSGERSSSSSEPGSPAPQAAEEEEDIPTTAAVEAGKAGIDDHLSYFSARLAHATLSPFPVAAPRLSIEGYRQLYAANAGSPRGAHFVVHQHDHPVAGAHYDLRLQINGTSSASWAIMYGLPGDPNGKRLNRNATETRVHCLWNHLIETASPSTGSLLIWDTGTYTVLPPQSQTHQDPGSQSSSSSSSSDEEDDPAGADAPTEQQKLHAAFQARKIRLRLHGTRLPDPYVLNLRLTRTEDAAGRFRAQNSSSRPRRRRRGGASTTGRGRRQAPEPMTSSDSDPDDSDAEIVQAGEGPGEGEGEGGEEGEISAMEREIRELEDDHVRATNAYPGAANTIASVHQRRWYVSLDRAASGFRRRTGSRRGGRGRGKGVVWEHGGKVEGDGDDGSGNGSGFPFYVRGPAVEQSVVTGRRGEDVLADEGVVGFVGRRGWRAVLE
ncbi:DNA polymerase ligase-domain-containing protein [Whalleya microplaca]|nr:DNA polymerase ligase-domain-containing protein [Whalleya microplaca]